MSGSDTQVKGSDRSAKIYFWIGLFVALSALGLPLIGVTVNIWLGGAVLALAFICLTRAFWIWERPLKWHVAWRIFTVVLATSIYIAVVGFQIRAEWNKEHVPVVASIKPEPKGDIPPAPLPKEQQRQPSKKPNTPPVQPPITTGPITQGDCGNVQIGGSGNQATTNCTNIPPQRILSPEQETVFINALGPNPMSSEVYCYSTDKEGCTYARSFFQALKKAHWDVGLQVGMFFDTPIDSQVYLTIKNKDASPHQVFRKSRTHL